ncbi:BRISC and BRCA1-A complex member 2-like isoform X2 [Scylla paramamosain]|uniref:BRISC and BRCA1-A complex member 2-like isoform X2 n=1 Tax=Scylla paramamosain TaxID=85552 RepID=UPI003083617F
MCSRLLLSLPRLVLLSLLTAGTLIPMEEQASLNNAPLNMFTRQMEYMKVNGVPGVLFSDCAEISKASEAQGVKNKGDNGEILECRPESYSENTLLIKLPYAGTNLTIHLLFNPQEPWMVPEMTFSDDRFTSTITLKDLEDQVPSLNEWDTSTDDILAQLVHQVLQLYRGYQLDRLEEDEILQIQYESLLKALKIGEGDIEVSVNSTEQVSTTSSFLMRLPLSLQDVPPVLVDANPGTPNTFLQVDFPRREAAFVPKLHLSSCVESLIGEASSLALPTVPPGIGVMDYVERIMELLEEKVRRTILSFETRKQFIAEVLCQFGCAVVEYDAERFNKIVVMMEVKDFHFLAFISLGSLFPQQHGPRVVLQSLYHNSAKEPVSKELTDLKYSSQWKPEEMVQHTKEAILANISSFQMSSIRTS